MRTLIRRMWRAAPVATVVLAVALAATVFFGLRTARHWVYWNDPAHRDQAVAGWMTPGYIAHSWQVPREVVTQAIGLERRPEGPRNLDRLAQNQGRSVDDLIVEIEAAIAAFRAAPADTRDTAEPERRP